MDLLGYMGSKENFMQKIKDPNQEIESYKQI